MSLNSSAHLSSGRQRSCLSTVRRSPPRQNSSTIQMFFRVRYLCAVCHVQLCAEANIVILYNCADSYASYQGQGRELAIP